MRVYSRRSPRDPSTLVWYADCFFWEGDKRKRRRRSTGIRDDGTVKSRRAAEAVGRDIQQSLATGKGRVARPTTIGQAIARLISDMELAQRAQPTINIVNEKAEHLFAFFGSAKPAEQVTKDELADYARWALKTRAPGTVERELITLRQALRAAGFTPAEMPELGNTLRVVERWADANQTRAILLALNPRWRDHVVVYRQMGIRKSELYRIEPSRGDIDWAAGHVRIRGTKTAGADRVVPMTAEVRGILWRRQAQRPLFELWRNMDRDLRLAGEKSGFGPISANDLRRSFTTELIIKDANPVKLMHLLGHKSLRMLEKHYARLGKSHLLRATVDLLEPLRAVEKTDEA